MAERSDDTARSTTGRSRDRVDLRRLRYFVAVADERHIGRAAARLHMAQPPLTRAMRQLERELGVELLKRGPKGVELTEAGTALHREARSVLDRVAGIPARITGAGKAKIAVGTCCDTAEQVGSRLVTEFRRLHPHVELTLSETDLDDPTAGLRADLVDVALTRGPFDAAGILTRTVRSDPVGVVMLDDDPLATRDAVSLKDLHDRRWIRLPPGTDRQWCSYWMADLPALDGADAPVVRTIQECLQSVLWSGASTLAPLHQVLPDGLVNVPVADKPASRLLVAWNPERSTPLVQSFVDIALGGPVPRPGGLR